MRTITDKNHRTIAFLDTETHIETQVDAFLVDRRAQRKSEADISKAAETAAVSRTTIYRWLKDPVFQNALNAAESEALAALSRKLVVLGGQAASLLDDAMRDANTPVSARLRAADIVLSRLLQLRELVQLDTRLTDLEMHLGI